MTEAAELRVCERCWNARNRPVGLHECGSPRFGACHCPCLDRKHSDLDTIDLDHDLGVKWMTDPFDPHGHY